MAKAVTEIQTGEKLDEPIRVPIAGGEVTQEYKTKTIQPGETVNKSDFSDEDWAVLVSSGSVVEDDEQAQEMLDNPQPASQRASDVMEVFSTAVPGTVQDETTGLPEGSEQAEETKSTAPKGAPKK